MTAFDVEPPDDLSCVAVDVAAAALGVALSAAAVGVWAWRRWWR